MGVINVCVYTKLWCYRNYSFKYCFHESYVVENLFVYQYFNACRVFFIISFLQPGVFLVLHSSHFFALSLSFPVYSIWSSPVRSANLSSFSKWHQFYVIFLCYVLFKWEFWFFWQPWKTNRLHKDQKSFRKTWFSKVPKIVYHLQCTTCNQPPYPSIWNCGKIPKICRWKLKENVGNSFSSFILLMCFYLHSVVPEQK